MPTPFNRNFAIIIGINNYQNGIKELKTAVPDACKLANILENQHKALKSQYQAQNQYEVKSFLDENASLEHLNQLIADFKQGQIPLGGGKVTVTKDDRLLFYFAGHGIALDALENQEGPVGYLIPQNAKSGDSSTYLPMQELHDALNALPCRHMLAILDCCFAGAFRWASLKREIVPKVKVYKERYDRFISDRAWQVITSAADDQKALDSLGSRGIITDGNKVHSPFAQALFDALGGKGADLNQDGIITATELYLYLRDQVEILTENSYKRQTPSLCPLKKHDKGEFIFLLPEFDRNQLEDAPPLNLENNPYRGLQSYDEKHSHLFFGRENLIQQLYQKTIANQQPLTLVLGASGTGKSSLMKAGLLPRLRSCQKQQFLILEPMRPGESPVKALTQICLPIGTITVDELVKNEQAFANLIELWSQNHTNTRLLLPVDQFEELVTLCKSDEEKEQFLTLIKQAIAKYPNKVHVVITLRLDFEAQFQTSVLKHFWNDDTRFVVPPMTQDELREVIEKPALEKVVYFDPPRLVDKLINEVVQMPGALPLLSFTLSELYFKYLEERRDNRALTEQDYHELGRVVGSLTKRANQEYEKLVGKNKALLIFWIKMILHKPNSKSIHQFSNAKNTDYKNTIRRIMLRMIALQGGELARRQVPKSELVYPDQEENARVQTVIKNFSEARLIVEGCNFQDEPYVEPAHDALVQGWDKLDKWKKEEEENLILQRRVIPAAIDWRSQQSAQFLWHNNPRLDLLKQLLKSNNNWLNKVEAEFVRCSIKERRKNTTRVWSITIGIILGLSLLTTFAVIQWQTAQKGSIQALIEAAKANLLSNQELEAMIATLKAGQKFKSLPFGKTDVFAQVQENLQAVVYEVKEHNRISSGSNASFSPDGKMILTTSGNTAKVWAKSGKLLSTLIGHTNSVDKASFSSDGKMILTTSYDRTAKIWHTTGNLLSTLPHINAIFDANFSPDGKMIVTTYNDGTAKIWDISGKLLHTLQGHQVIYIYEANFSPDGKMIVTASADKTAKVWDTNGKLLHTLTGHTDGLNNASFSPNGKMILTTSFDKTAKVWDTNGKLLHTLTGYTNYIRNASFSPDGKMIVTASADKTAKVWDTNGKLLHTLTGHTDGLNNAIFSPDGKMIVTASADKTAKVWDSSGNLLSTLQYPNAILDANFSPDGKTILTSSGNLKVWDRSRKLLPTLTGHTSGLNNAIFSPDGKMIVTTSAGDKIAKIWDTSGNLLSTLVGHQVNINNASFSPDGKMIVTASTDKTAKVWDSSGNLLSTLIGHKNLVLNAIFSPDSKMIVTASADNTAKNWDINGKLLFTLIGHRDFVNNASFSPDGKMIVTASTDKTAMLWDINGNLRYILIGHTAGLNNAIFSPDGKMIVTASADNTAKVWDTSGKLVHTLTGHTAGLNNAIFSPDGKMIVTASADNTAKVWDTSGKLVHTLTGHTAGLNNAIFSPDGKMIVTASADNTAKVWDTSGNLLSTLIGHKNLVLNAIFSPDSKMIVTASADNTAKVWRLESIDELMVKGCDWVRDYLENNSNVNQEDKDLCEGWK